jgi:hypothetical protein
LRDRLEAGPPPDNFLSTLLPNDVFEYSVFAIDLLLEAANDSLDAARPETGRAPTAGGGDRTPPELLPTTQARPSEIEPGRPVVDDGPPDRLMSGREQHKTLEAKERMALDGGNKVEARERQFLDAIRSLGANASVRKIQKYVEQKFGIHYSTGTICDSKMYKQFISIKNSKNQISGPSVRTRTTRAGQIDPVYEDDPSDRVAGLEKSERYIELYPPFRGSTVQ